jgi:hypothetical protein
MARAPKRPSLFKERDLTRAIRSARKAGATKLHVEIDKAGTIAMDVGLGETETTDGNEVDETERWLEKHNANQR